MKTNNIHALHKASIRIIFGLTLRFLFEKLPIKANKEMFCLFDKFPLELIKFFCGFIFTQELFHICMCFEIYENIA